MTVKNNCKNARECQSCNGNVSLTTQSLMHWQWALKLELVTSAEVAMLRVGC